MMVLAAAAALSMSVLACSEDDNGASPSPSNNNQEDPDAGADADVDPDPDADTGPGTDADADPDPDADVGPDPDADADLDPDADVDPDPDADNGENGEEEYPKEEDWLCGPQINLGELGVGETELDVDFDSFDNTLSTECDVDGSSSAAIFRFDVPSGQDVIGELEIVTDDEVTGELREFHCNDQDSESFGCLDDDQRELLQPGMTYFLVLESVQESPPEDPEVTLNFEEYPGCMDPGGQCVDDDTVETCQLIFPTAPDQPIEVVQQCPTAECTDDACVGDSCDNPISVTSSFEWSGTNATFFDEHNSSEEIEDKDDPDDITCFSVLEWDDDGEIEEVRAVDTPGRDLVFEVGDLSDDDEIVVSADYEPFVPSMQEDDEVTVVFKDSCSDVADCLHAVSGPLVEDGSEVTFSVDEAGGASTIFVFIDTTMEFAGHLDISIKVEDGSGG